MGTKKATKPQASESTQSAQEVAMSTVTQPVVKFIEVKQGSRMTGFEFQHWLVGAHGDIEQAEEDRLMKFVDDMGATSSDSHQHRFLARRILPRNIDDVITPSVNAVGLIDVVMITDNNNRPSGYQIVRFFTLRTKFQEQGNAELKEVVDSIMQPESRGLVQLPIKPNQSLTLGELGNFIAGTDPVMREQAERSIDQIKKTFSLLYPNSPPDTVSRLMVKLERTYTARVSPNHRLTEGILDGSVLGPIELPPGSHFAFRIVTDVVTESSTGNLTEVVNEFWCAKLQELTAEAARLANKDKLRMSSGSEFMAKPATNPDVLGGLFKASQSEPSKMADLGRSPQAEYERQVTLGGVPELAENMSWTRFLGWLTCAIQPVIAGKLHPFNEALQKAILDNLYWRIGRAPDGQDHSDLVRDGKTYVDVSAYYVDVVPSIVPNQLIIQVKGAGGVLTDVLRVVANIYHRYGVPRVQIIGIAEGQDRITPKITAPLEITGHAPVISMQKNAGTIFTTDAFAFLNHAMGALGSLLTDEEQLKAQVFIRFIDQMYPLKGVSGETFEVEFEEHDRLHVTALEGHDEVARLHLKLK